jgi:hypothetical protein
MRLPETTLMPTPVVPVSIVIAVATVVLPVWSSVLLALR